MNKLKTQILLLIVMFAIGFASLTTSIYSAYAATPDFSELRLGVMQHDLGDGLKQRHERGQNIIAEYIFNNQYEWLWGVPHIGATINNRGYTSAIYTGLTWRLDLPARFFIDATLGGGINNAERKTPKKRQAVGSNILFRESLSLGFQIDSYSFSIMVDHMSNARLAPPNPGLTDFGVRFGLKF